MAEKEGEAGPAEMAAGAGTTVVYLVARVAALVALVARVGVETEG